jgi:phosphohistidine phosphatase
MQLILVRHAEAVPIGMDGVRSDFDRHLSPLGQQQAAELADALAVRGLGVELILTSPFVRAKQTSEPLRKLLREDSRGLLLTDYLAVGELRRKRLTQTVADLNVEVAILVGHNPDLEQYLGWLIGGDSSSIKMVKGAIASIQFQGSLDEGQGTLEWLLTPAWYGRAS